MNRRIYEEQCCVRLEACIIQYEPNAHVKLISMHECLRQVSDHGLVPSLKKVILVCNHEEKKQSVSSFYLIYTC